MVFIRLILFRIETQNIVGNIFMLLIFYIQDPSLENLFQQSDFSVVPFTNSFFFVCAGSKPSNFAGNVFPAIIFFCATVELLYYFGVVQVIVRKFATFFLYLMGTSGIFSFFSWPPTALLTYVSSSLYLYLEMKRRKNYKKRS